MTEKLTEEELDLDAVLNTDAGRRVLYRILMYTDLDQDVFNKDPITHAKNAGKRNVGVWLRNVIVSQAPNRFITMLKESINE